MRAFLALAGTLLVLGSSPVALGTAKPALRLDAHVLMGMRFRAHEQVRLTFISETRRSEVVTTNGSGAFSTPFPSMASCLRPLVVKAIGTRGDTAMLKVAHLACMPR